MDIDFADGYGSHDFQERAQKRQRLDNDPIPSAASELPASTIGELDSWHHSVNGDKRLLIEGLWMPGFLDLQNDLPTWSSPTPEVASYSGGGVYQREQSYSSFILPRLQVPPGEPQQNSHSPVTEESTDVEVEEGGGDEESNATPEQERGSLLCFGMVKFQSCLFLNSYIDLFRSQIYPLQRLSQVC